MITIEGKKRNPKEEKSKKLIERGILPGVLYGPEIENIPIQFSLKDFAKIYEQAGETSLISLKIDNKKYLALIHDIKNHPLTGAIIHVDFYQPILTKEVEVWVPLIFEGEAPAVKDLGGTLVKEIQEIEVRALPEKLPHEIRVNVSILKTFEDEILVKDLKLPEGVKVNKEEKDIIALVTPIEKVEEELEKPIEEDVEKVEKTDEQKLKEEIEEKDDE